VDYENGGACMKFVKDAEGLPMHACIKFFKDAQGLPMHAMAVLLERSSAQCSLAVSNP
jgi:hypothetical protein